MYKYYGRETPARSLESEPGRGRAFYIVDSDGLDTRYRTAAPFHSSDVFAPSPPADAVSSSGGKTFRSKLPTIVFDETERYFAGIRFRRIATYSDNGRWYTRSRRADPTDFRGAERSSKVVDVTGHVLRQTVERPLWEGYFSQKT